MDKMVLWLREDNLFKMEVIEMMFQVTISIILIIQQREHTQKFQLNKDSIMSIMTALRLQFTIVKEGSLWKILSLNLVLEATILLLLRDLGLAVFYLD